MAISDMFDGLGDAQASSVRIPDPKPGEADFLLNTMRIYKTEAGQRYIKFLLTCVRPRTEGGNQIGDRVSVVLFKGGPATVKYYYQDLKAMLVALTNTDENEMEELSAALCAQYEVEDYNMAWSMLGLAACARDAEDHELEAGTFDNQAVVTLRSFVKPGKIVEGEYMDNPEDPTGDKIAKRKKDFLKTVPDGGVTFTELAGSLEENEIKLLFGTQETFDELIAAEAE